MSLTYCDRLVAFFKLKKNPSWWSLQLIDAILISYIWIRYIILKWHFEFNEYVQVEWLSFQRQYKYRPITKIQYFSSLSLYGHQTVTLWKPTRCCKIPISSEKLKHTCKLAVIQVTRCSSGFHFNRLEHITWLFQFSSLNFNKSAKWPALKWNHVSV